MIKDCVDNGNDDYNDNDHYDIDNNDNASLHMSHGPMFFVLVTKQNTKGKSYNFN